MPGSGSKDSRGQGLGARDQGLTFLLVSDLVIPDHIFSKG